MQSQVTFRAIGFFLRILLILNVSFGGALAAEWPSWRGPNQNGSSPETDLVSEWSVDGENLIWEADFIGRSTPIVLNGRVYVIGRVGEGITEQEQVACFDAETGKPLWEHRFNVFHSTIPFNRLGWTSLVGDTETGNIYAHAVSGIFFCFDKDGKILWTRSLTEEFGRFTGYGGRVVTPIVYGDLVIVSFLNRSWGEQAPMRHRYFAFDKRTGDVVWVATPGRQPKDTTYSVPVVAEINGRLLLIDGHADGYVYAMDVNTGEKVWGFQVSQGPLNSSVVVDGTRVYATHSKENTDTIVMGRIVCIDGTGTGDVTNSHEVWRVDGIEAGYSSPALHGDRLYVVDNSANLYALDKETGTVHWQHSLGTVGKGSPVWADGKLYVAEVNGNFHILEPSEDECRSLHVANIERKAGRYAEIYGSPAIAYGRVYFTTEEGLYCLGDKEAKFSASSGGGSAPLRKKAADNATVATIRVVPTEVITPPGETAQFSARTFDNLGLSLTRHLDVAWSLNGLSGVIDGSGKLTINKSSGPQTGTIVAKIGDLEGAARVRVVPELPWSEDFESIDVDKHPPHWVGATGKFFVREKDGNKVLVKPPAQRGLDRSNAFIGPPNLKNYTIQCDLMGTKPRRNLPDMGLIANRYTLIMLGNHQRLQILSWASDLRMAKHVDFKWEPDVWYTMKMKVDTVDDKAIVKGKVWRTGQPEPDAWTITAEDPLPNREGSPGINGYSPADIYYDNLKVW